MPSKSNKQRRFMAAAANNPKFAKKAGIKQSVAKEFHNADKYRGGGLATMAKDRFIQGSKPMIDPAMRRPPPRGGLSTATKPMPARPSARMRPKGRFPVNRPRFGALSAYTGSDGSSGGIRRPQGSGMGRSRFMGRVPGSQPGNALLRTAGNASMHAGNRLNSMMGRMGPMRFAKGGKVGRAIKALNEARSWLFDASEEQPELAKKFLNDVPGGQKLKDSIDEAVAMSEGLDAVRHEKELKHIFEDLQRRFDETEIELEDSGPSTFRPAGEPAMEALNEIEQIRRQNFPGRILNEKRALLENARQEVEQLRMPAAYSDDPEVNMLIRKLREKTRRGGETTPEIEEIVDRLEELGVDWPEFLP